MNKIQIDKKYSIKNKKQKVNELVGRYIKYQ